MEGMFQIDLVCLFLAIFFPISSTVYIEQELMSSRPFRTSPLDLYPKPPP